MWFKDKWYKYFKPLHKSVNMQFNPDCWTKAQNLYDNWKFKESFVEVLKYADKKIKKFQISEWIYKIPHGSIFLDVDFSWDILKISSDFLEVSEANKIPLYRRISELNFSALNLTQIKLIDNKLIFDFSCPLEFYNPYKIWEVLADICYFADKHDEEFCQQYWAKPLAEAEIKEIPENKKEEIYKNFVEIISSNLEIIKDLEDRRRNNFAWDVISTTYKMIDYACAPKWVLALRISEKVNELYDRDQALDTIIFRWKEFLKEISEMPKEEFFKSIFEVKEFIPNKRVATVEQISEYLRPGWADADSDLHTWDAESAYLIFMHILYNSMYYHIMPYGMEKAIVSAIKWASEQKVDKSSVTILSNKVFKIVQVQNIPSNSSGFFAFIWWVIAWFFMEVLFGG